MRLASSQYYNEILYEALRGASLTPWCFLYVWHNGAWVIIEDVDTDAGFAWSKNSKKIKFANYAFLPEPTKLSFNVYNFLGKYSEGSGAPEEGFFGIDKKIKLVSGYVLNEKYKDGSIGVYDYSDFVDGGNGYSFLIVSTDRIHKEIASFFVDLADDIEIGYRFFRDESHVEYYDAFSSTIGALDSLVDQNGFFLVDENGFFLTDNDYSYSFARYERRKYLQFKVLTSDVSKIKSLEIFYEDFFVDIYKDVLYLDSPSFGEPADPAIPKISIDARDPMKYLLNYSVSPYDYDGMRVDEMLKYICDLRGIKYTAASIDVIVGSERVNALNIEKDETAEWHLERILQIASAFGKYVIFFDYDENEDDQVIFLKKVNESLAADFVFDFRQFNSIGERKKNYDKVLERLTIQTDDQPLQEEQLLFTQTYTSNQINLKVTLNGGLSFLHRIEIGGTGGVLTDIKIENNVSMLESYSYLTITASPTETAIVKIYGCPWESLAPAYSGEAISASNTLISTGNNVKILNPFIKSSTEAKKIAEFFVSENGVPIDETRSISYPYLNLLLQINDMALLWGRYVWTTDLRVITGISYNWSLRSGVINSSSFNCDDAGIDLDLFIYDRGYVIDKEDFGYDTGLLYDMIDGPQGDEAAQPTPPKRIILT